MTARDTQIRQRVAVLMADGRERTTGDVARDLRIKNTEARMHLRALLDYGLLSSQRVSDVAIWQVSPKMRAQARTQAATQQLQEGRV